MRFPHLLFLMLLAVLAACPIASAKDRPVRPERQAQSKSEQAKPDLAKPDLAKPDQAKPDLAKTDQAKTDQAKPEQAKSDDGRGAGVLQLLPPDSVTEKEITLGGRKIVYTATAGTLSLFNQSGDKSAAVFYTAYVAKNAEPDADAARRPVTFVFNGGPGAASVYLNLGLAGPRIVDFGPGSDGAAAKLVDNPDSWLAFTDLVMIDPIGTGWSRTTKPDDAKGFYSVRSDANFFAKVIALYVAKNSRSASPKYLLGESYGGFRAAKVANALKNDQGIIVTGIVMVSPLLETSFLWGGTQYALGAALQFPALVATELERDKKFTPAALAEAERFAMNEYLTTLAGAPPSGDKAIAFYGRIATMTGLPVEVVAKTRGNVRAAYLQHLRANGQATSIYDATFAVPDPYPESVRGGGTDPILDGFTRALSGAFVGYARDELGFKTDMTYILLGHDVSSNWDWGNRREPPGVSDDLRELLALTPSFRLLVAHGRTDLVTPYGVSRYVIDHLPELGAPERAQLKVYRGGHMFYFDAQTRRDFTADAKSLYRPGP